MAKVIIEHNGQVREFEKDAVIAFFPDEENTRLVVMGRISINRAVRALSAGIPRILELLSDDRIEYVNTMSDVRENLDEKIKEELKVGAIHTLVDALVETIEEELER